MNSTRLFKPSVILFDVNETLLDMSPLRKQVNKLLKSKRGFKLWFTMLLQYSLVDNCTNQYNNFSAIGEATLYMAAKSLKQSLSVHAIRGALSTLKQLPAHDDVKEALDLLKDAGVRLATLSNSPMETSKGQLEYAGLTGYFESILSVDSIKKYKPALEAYRYAAQVLKVNTDEMLMVAAHGWDITGASHAGLHTCFIERKGQSLYPLAPKPSITGSTLITAARKIIKRIKFPAETFILTTVKNNC
ncbi:MAG: haloacid dehalogenase type II [Cyclobacteriaceae bacterium]